MSHEDGGHIFYGLGSRGLTRIDWLAGIFVAAMLSSPSQVPENEAERQELASLAYDIASGVLAERHARFPGCDRV